MHTAPSPIRCPVLCIAQMQRSLLWVVLVGVGTGWAIFFAASAEGQLFRGFRKTSNPIPVVFRSTPTKAQLLQHLNSQSQRVRQIDASVSLSMTGAPKLKGTIQIERPKNLRLKAGILGVNEIGVDVGSNDQLFWIWMRAPIPGQEPTLLFANHQEFENSNSAIRRAIPIEPKWLIAAVGLAEFSDTDAHIGPEPMAGGHLKLTTVSDSAVGRMYRITIVDAKRGLIEQQSVYNGHGELVAYTNSKQYRFYPEHAISLPHRIEMHLFEPGAPEQKLVVSADQFSINSLFGDPNRMWRLPNPSNVRKVDLAKIGVTRSRQP